MIKVALVDDHQLVSRGIEALLNSVNDIQVVGVCDSGEQALQVIAQKRPDVVLMDIYMPGMGGLEACRLVLQLFPRVKLLGLSVSADQALTRQLLELGVMGFISKASPTEEMLAAIRAAAVGKVYLSPPLSAANQESASPFSRLSKRESDVARLVLQGMSIRQIADKLQLNSKTVNTYRYRMYGKLQIKNDVELARLASGKDQLQMI